jgi:hypothetical protein
MKKNIRIISLFLMVFLIKPFCVSSQTSDCSVNYEKALLLYNSGMADSALSIIKPCLGNNDALNKISKETRARIFRLAALSSIMNGNPTEAEKYARKMLINQPDYKNNPDESDLQEFRLMLDKITPQPSLRIGVTAGINIPFVKLQKEYSNYELQSGKYILKGSVGYQFGIVGEKALSKNISLEAGAGISQVMFNYTISGIDVLTYQTLKNLYDQKVNWIEVPVSAKYYFNLKSFRPYLEGGITGRLLINSMEKSGTYGRYWFTNSSNSDKILTTFLADFENFGILLGGGVCYDFNKFSLRLGFRYNYYLKNSGTSSNFDNVTGYDDFGPGEKFHYTDDINLVNLKHLQVSVGILYNLSYKVF